MIEAVMLWNEPNNLSHWDFSLDKDWSLFGSMVCQASTAIRAECRQLTQVLGGISPIDPSFIGRMTELGVVDAVDAIGVHGFPLDWNHWTIHEWPQKLGDIRAVTDKPIWVSEVGVSSFGADEVQEFGLARTAEILIPLVKHIHWYSLYDLPRAWPATTRHREAEGSAYYRHFYMGLVRENDEPKPALKKFAELAPEMGICQWVHYEDHRLDGMIRLLRDLGVKKLRTGLSWADFGRPNALGWFDKQMTALEAFDLTVTFCFTPENKGIAPHHTSPPTEPQEFADFCASMVRRYVC